MLTELSESEATGEIARIFAEIRQLYATPYVSSIHRHMATRPGVLEWAWGSVAPAFRDGRGPETGWRIAADAALAPIPTIPAASLRVWGVGPGDAATVAAIAESFTRVAPVNLVFGGLVRSLLQGHSPGGGSVSPKLWTPPPALAPPPPMVDAASLGDNGRALLELFRSGTGASAFVPGLYRMLARWPGLLAHLAVELGPRFAAPETLDVARDLLARTDAAVASILASLPTPPAGLPPAPDAAEAAHLAAMIDNYRKTSPEMILFGRLIREAVSGN